MADKKQAAQKKAPKGRWGLYKAEGSKLVRKNKSCPKCGEGTFMAQHKDRLVCGACHYMEKSKSEN